MVALQPSRGGVGYLLLAVPVLLWVLSSFISNAIFTDLQYNKPFFAAYLNTASFVLYLLPIWRTTPNRSDDVSAPLATDDLGPLSEEQTKQLARIFCLIWFASNVLGNLGLGMTSVSSMTILGSMSGLFTLVVGALGGVEHFNTMRMSAVLVSICGVIILSSGDKQISSGGEERLPDADPRVPRHALFGDLFALGAALTYAIYTVMLKKRCGDERRISMTTFFGYVGLYNVLFLFPILLLLHYTRLEVFEIPRNKKLIASLVLNAAFTFAGDCCMMAAMLRTSPLAVTLGLSLQIPLALFGDLLRGTRIGGLHVLLGAVLIVTAFLAVGISDARHQAAATQKTPRVSVTPRASESDPLIPG